MGVSLDGEGFKRRGKASTGREDEWNNGIKNGDFGDVSWWCTCCEADATVTGRNNASDAVHDRAAHRGMAFIECVCVAFIELVGVATMRQCSRFGKRWENGKQAHE